MNTKISVSGVRGIVGDGFDPQIVVNYVGAFAEICKVGKIVVGRDTRITGLAYQSLVNGILSCKGFDVIDLGVVPTPTVAMEVIRQNAQGGIILTASHNPIIWNALKFLNADGEFISTDNLKKMHHIIKEGSIKYSDAYHIGTIKKDNHAIKHHIEAILDLSLICPQVIQNAKFSVAINAIGGTGAIAIPELLHHLNVSRIEKFQCNIDGFFPNNPEPLPEYLNSFGAFVKEKKCDIGVVTDPDADRLALVMSDGGVFGEENTQAMAVDLVLTHTHGCCVTNISSSCIVDDIAKKHHSVCYRSKVGEWYVVSLMKKKNAIIGGEGNGGVIYSLLHYGRDALLALAMVLQLLAERSISLLDYKKQLPSKFMKKVKILVKTPSIGKILKETFIHKFRDYQPSYIDGIYIKLNNGWILLRESNTEPIFRLFVETNDEYQSTYLIEDIIRYFKKNKLEFELQS